MDAFAKPSAGIDMDCQSCQKEYDFENNQSGSCSTCEKKYICPDCYWTHDCIEGKGRRLRIITNPKWICNLINNMNSSDEINAKDGE